MPIMQKTSFNSLARAMFNARNTFSASFTASAVSRSATGTVWWTTAPYNIKARRKDAAPAPDTTLGI